MKLFYLVTTEHLEDRLWFRDEEDFRVAMNYVAVVAFIPGVSVLSFILMSNHVHFVLCCSHERAELFINKFKRLYAAYYRRKYGVCELLRRNGVDIREVREHDESLEKAIAYVVAPGGYILPESYVPVKGVESLFRTPKRLGYFLRTSSKARLRLEGNAVPSFRDQNILSACEDLCHSLFRVERIEDLNEEQEAELLRQLGRRFSADLNQLCRVTGISYAEAARMLDSY